jgi:hypothetical protein
MKIKVIDSTTKKPVLNTKIQLQVKGKDSGYLTLTTDATGTLQLDDKYNGQQLLSTTGGQGGPAITATEGAVLLLTLKQNAPLNK